MEISQSVQMLLKFVGTLIFFLFKKQQVRPFFIILNSIFQTCKVFSLLRYCFWYAQQVVIKFAFQIKMFSKLITRVVLSEKVLKSSYESSSLSLLEGFYSWHEKKNYNSIPSPSLLSLLLFYFADDFTSPIHLFCVRCKLSKTDESEWERGKKTLKANLS